MASIDKRSDGRYRALCASFARGPQKVRHFDSGERGVSHDWHEHLAARNLRSNSSDDLCRAITDWWS